MPTEPRVCPKCGTPFDDTDEWFYDYERDHAFRVFHCADRSCDQIWTLHYKYDNMTLGEYQKAEDT